MTNRLLCMVKSGLAIAACVAAATLGAGVPAALAATDAPSDPALQQVVTDDEAINRADHIVFDHGHCDLGPRLVDGKWELLARDDTVSPSVWRPIDNIVFKVSDKAKMKLPEGDDYSFTGAKGGDDVYVIPQSEIAGVPWLGWSTQSPAVVNGVDGQLKLTFEGHQGKGQFTNFYQAGNFGGPEQNWSSVTKQAQTLNVDLNTHVHTNWVFTQPGVHLVRVTAQATLKGGQTVTATHVLRFAVGDQTSTDEAARATWAGQAHEQAHPADQAKATGDTKESSRGVLAGVGIGLAIVGVVAIIVAVALVRSSKKRRDAALAAAAAEKAEVDQHAEGDSADREGDQ
ncbi:MAG: choice-of-anchor M domain-containing protein [Actinomycetaceae bacterium]|nr:choice-of-anchor M domain-containing protein [Actinomycetaceae bacterium]MDU0970565.1 choice-of-anchor M domain-containing protein [Actinomycetaceae bacterium]